MMKLCINCVLIVNKGVGEGVGQGGGGGSRAFSFSEVGWHKWVCAPPPHFWAEQMFQFQPI